MPTNKFIKLIEISREIEAEREQRRITLERHNNEIRRRNSERMARWLEDTAYYYVFYDVDNGRSFLHPIKPNSEPPKELKYPWFVSCIVSGGVVRAEKVRQYMRENIDKVLSQRGEKFDPRTSWVTDALQ